MKIRTNNIMSPHSTVLGVLIVFMGILSACCGGSESSPTRAATPQSAEVPNATIQAVSGSTTIPGTSTGRASVLIVNTNWKPRTETINGKILTYVFGKGNPPEVALQPQQYLATGNGNGPYAASGTKIGLDYVTPEVEAILMSVLSNPALPVVLKSCGLNVDAPFIGADQFTSLSLDINNILTIEATSKRKVIDMNVLDGLGEAFQMISGQINGQYKIWGPKNAYATCVPANQITNYVKLASDIDVLSNKYQAIYRDTE